MLLSLANNNITVESIDQAYLNNFLKDKLANKEADSLAEAMLDTMLEVDLLKVEWERKELRKRQEEDKKKELEELKKKDSYREGVKELYPRTRNKDARNYVTVKEATEMIGCSKKTFYLLVKENFGKI